MTMFVLVMGALVLGYLILRANSLWVYKVLDRALRNDRNILPKSYELPKYYKLKAGGEIDVSSRWPGWDGWYFFMVPDDKNLPVKMVRASLMTGLYGLKGIDNYENLPPGLSAFDVVEYLTLIPMEDGAGGTSTKENHLSQHYLPKGTSLAMNPNELEITVAEGQRGRYGQISGSWPTYEFQFITPETGINFSLSYTGEKLVWWTDMPQVFTYFAAFGRFSGSLTYKRETGVEQVYALEGSGFFEHGFARKPGNFDNLWAPIRWLKKLLPSLRPVRYHYELLLGDQPHQGGFMYVRALGITWRNRGGLYVDNSYREVNHVQVEYLQDPAPDLLPIREGEPPLPFYRSWKVKAETGEGILEYVGIRQWPPALIASNMIYYNFSYEGTYRGEVISGRGYGEYVHI
ncbi:MAG: hypothetical protein WC600_04265 [Desulfobaccales bacterium]